MRLALPECQYHYWLVELPSSLHLHHSAAEHGDDNHEHPAGENAEAPQNVAENSGHAILRDSSVERVKDAIVETGLGLVALLTQLNQIIRGSGC